MLRRIKRIMLSIWGIDRPETRLIVLIGVRPIDPAIIRPVLYTLIDDLLGSIPALLPLAVDGGGGAVDPSFDVVREGDGDDTFLIVGGGDHDVGGDALRLLALV